MEGNCENKGFRCLISTRNLAFLLTVIYAILLVPILMVSFYAHPVMDDFSYTVAVHHAIENGAGLFAILQTIVERVVDIYIHWQGTYSAVFLFSLQPGVFSPKLYFLTTFLMIGALTFSTWVLFKTVQCDWLKRKKTEAIILSIITLIMCIEFIPNKSEAFYWYNGCSYYTLFHCLALTICAFLIRLYFEKNDKKRGVIFGGLILGCVILGGGNYSTALLMSELLIIITGIFIMKRDKKWHYYLILTIIFLICFIISMAAPGNGVRAETSAVQSPIRAIIVSLVEVYFCMGKWTKLPQVIYLIFALPFVAAAAKNCRWEFKNPLLVMGIAYGLFASLMTPAFYAMSIIGAGRQIDLYYYDYYLLLLFCEFYVSGWFWKHFSQIDLLEIIRDKFDRYIPAVLFVMVFFFGAGCLEYHLHNITSVDTALALVNGQAQKYDQEYLGIISEIEAGEGDVILSDIKTVPDFFKPFGFSEDITLYTNADVAAYYGVDSIILAGESIREEE